MPIYIRIYKTKAVFGYSEDIHQQMDEWISSVDKKFLKKQIKLKKPANYSGRPFVDDGVERPYYGVVGGAYDFCFQQTSTSSSLKIKNSFTGDSIKFVSEKEPSQPKRKVITCFSIGRTLLQRINKWKISDKDKTDEANYIYEFCPTTIGDTIIVRNSKTKREIDLTDYDNW